MIKIGCILALTLAGFAAMACNSPSPPPEMKSEVKVVPVGGIRDPSIKPVTPNPVSGVRDPSVKPISPTPSPQRGGIPDDSIKPVARGGGVDDSIKPAAPTKAGVADDGVRTR